VRSSAALGVAVALLVSTFALAEPPRGVDFQAALSAALLHSPLLERAEGERDEARAQVRAARAVLLPRVTVNGTASRLDSDRVLGERVLVPATGLNGNVTAVVPVVNAQAWLTLQRVEQGLVTVDASRDEVRRAVARAVAGAYVAVVLRQQLRDVAARAVQVAEAHVGLSRARLESGVASRLDVLRAERELSDNRSRWASAQAELSQAQEVLGAVTGDGVALDAAGMPQLGKLPTAEESVGALATRPDVRAAEARLQVAEREVQDRWADYVPQLSLQAQPFAAAPATPTVPNLGWQAQLQLGWLAYDGGGIQARHEAAEARVRQQRAAVAQLKLTGTAEVRAAYAALSQREVAEAEARVSARLAGEAAGLAKRQFEEGVAGNLELVDAERAARDAESAAAVARAALVAAKVDCLVASGVLAGE
jgi:outer membrane protein TolC